MVQFKVSVALILAAAAAIVPVVAQPPHPPLLTVDIHPNSRSNSVQLTRTPGTNAQPHIQLERHTGVNQVAFQRGPNPRNLHVATSHLEGSLNNFRINSPGGNTLHDIIINHPGHYTMQNEYEEEVQGGLVQHFTVHSTHAREDTATQFHIHYPDDTAKALTEIHVQQTRH